MEGIAQVYRDMPKGYTGVERNKCEDRPRASEEISTSLCLKVGLNVEAEPARDDALREYVMVDPYHNHLNWNRTEQGEWWFWPTSRKMRLCWKSAAQSDRWHSTSTSRRSS